MEKNFLTTLNIFALLLAVIFGALDVTETLAVESILRLDQKWSGDFDGMAERHVIRALVPYSKTFYFLDGADQRGVTYELLKEFEQYINEKLKKKTLKVRLVVVPIRRDQLLPGLLEGLGDIAAGNLTITPEREKLVDFSIPGAKGVDEIIVSGPASPPLKTIDDLSGKEVHVRTSSSYYDSLKHLNLKFRKAGKEPIHIVPADEHLEDEDLLEMMNAGLIPMIVIDSHKGKFWSQIFTNLKFFRGK